MNTGVAILSIIIDLHKQFVITFYALYYISRICKLTCTLDFLKHKTSNNSRASNL